MVSVTGLRMAAVAGMATISKASGSVNANANTEKVGRDEALSTKVKVLLLTLNHMLTLFQYF